MDDAYGIPSSFFGSVSDEFYGMVGRVVLVAALLEDRLLCLLWALDRAPQPTHAGKLRSELMTLCREKASVLSANLRDDMIAFLDDSDRVFDQRNAIVHSVWPDPSLTSARGWRSVVEKRRQVPHDYTVWIATDESKLRALLAEMVSLVERCNSLEAAAPLA
jgi:hypothetical protein